MQIKLSGFIFLFLYFIVISGNRTYILSWRFFGCDRNFFRAFVCLQYVIRCYGRNRNTFDDIRQLRLAILFCFHCVIRQLRLTYYYLRLVHAHIGAVKLFRLCRI